MYRLLIVDDEAIITDGLFEVFRKLDLELDLCKAYSGVEAIETMKQNRVDIVLTDIRMPDMNGLELMDYIDREWPHCKIIFLTGYNDFDYVYKAIQRSGVSYILKNEGYQKVTNAVRKAVRQLDSDLRINDLVRQSQERLNTLEALLQGEYLRHLIKGTRGADELKEDFVKLNIPLKPDRPYIAVLGVLTGPGLQDSYVNRQETGLAVKFLAQSFLADKVEHIGVLDRYNDLLWIIQPKVWPDHSTDPSIESMIRHLAGTFELIEQACVDSLRITMAFTITGHLLEWRDLPRVYDQLRQLQNVRVGDGTHMVQVVHIEETPESVSTPIHSSLENMELLAIHLEGGRREEFLEVFDRSVQSIVPGDPFLPTIVMEAYYAIALVILSYVNRMNLIDKISIHKLLSIEDHPSWEEGFAFLRKTADSLFEYRKKGEKTRAVHAIDQVCVYIENHLDQDLSLTRLANMFHFNPSYLSRLFKQECGVNLSEYIEERRMKRAKELLKRNDLKISEVGVGIGYDAPHSFTRFFKKTTGMTPQDYRDRIREMEMKGIRPSDKTGEEY